MFSMAISESASSYKYTQTVRFESTGIKNTVITHHSIFPHYLPIYGIIACIIFIVLSSIIYFLPSIIAIRRKHHNVMAICALNLFLGWSFLGWVGALIWSLL